MPWRDQHPPATDVLLHLNVPCSGGGTPARLEIDKLPEGRYRATVGTLVEHQEICRTATSRRWYGRPMPWRPADPLMSLPPSGPCAGPPRSAPINKGHP
jgi:hypothetical protein